MRISALPETPLLAKKISGALPMALSLFLTVSGTVASDVVKVQVNGVQATLTGTAYTAEVPVALGVVSITATTATGLESVRTMQVVVTNSAVV
jgi:hypothetical protein